MKIGEYDCNVVRGRLEVYRSFGPPLFLKREDLLQMLELFKLGGNPSVQQTERVKILLKCAWNGPKKPSLVVRVDEINKSIDANPVDEDDCFVLDKKWCTEDPGTGQIFTCKDMDCPVHGERNRTWMPKYWRMLE